MKACPSCGNPGDDAATECSNCGVIFAKWVAKQDQPPLSPAAPAEPVTLAEGVAVEAPSRTRRLALPVLLGCVLVGGAYYLLHDGSDEDLSAEAVPGAFFPIVSGAKRGFIDSRGVLQIQPQYDDARQPSEGLAAASKEGKYGFIDETGRVAVLFEFAKVADFHEGLAFYSTGGTKWGVIDSSGTRLTDPLFEAAGDEDPSFSGGLANVRVDGKAVYIDRQGRTMLGPYEYALPFHEGMAAVSSAGPNQWGCINTAGQLLIPPADRSGELVFSEGMAPVQSGDVWGYINREGAPAIPPSYKAAGDFREGLAPVQKANKWGAIDHQGHLVFTLGSDVTLLHPFSEGMAVYETELGKGYVDRTGRVVVKAVYDDARDYDHGLAFVSRRSRPFSAYLNKRGRPVWHANTAVDAPK